MSSTDFTKLSSATGAPTAQPERTVHTFRVPKAIASFGIESVGLVELRVQEELNGAKRALGDPMRTAYELAQESLRYVNGQRVTTVDGTADAAWAKMHPKVRHLVVTAYGKLHQPEDADVRGFLDSQESQVG